MEECGNLWNLLAECPQWLDHTRAPLPPSLSALAELPEEGRGYVSGRRAFFSQRSVMIPSSDANEERRSSPLPALPHAERGCARGAVPAWRGGDMSTSLQSP